MKKLLAMVMAMTMLCASMGVLAADGEETVIDPNVVWTFGAELTDINGAMPFYSSGNTAYATMSGADAEASGITPVSGERVMFIKSDDDSVTGAQIFNCFPTYMPELEAGTHYRLSFYHYNTGGISTPVLLVSGGGTTIDPRGGSFAAYPAGATNAWNYYELDFVTAKSMEEGTKLNMSVRSQNGANIAYDDFKLEKVNGADIRFVSGTIAKGTVATVLSQSATKDYQTGQADYIAKTADEKDVLVYPSSVLANDATAATGTINVVSSYIPKTKDETTTLCIAVYEENGDLPQLKDVIIENQTYTYTEVKSEDETVNHYYLGEDRMKTVPVDMSQYEGCYIKAFMWSSVSGLVPISGTETLPAAVAETPTE